MTDDNLDAALNDPITDALIETPDTKTEPPKQPVVQSDPNMDILKGQLEELKSYKQQMDQYIGKIQNDPKALQAVNDALNGRSAVDLNKVLDIDLSSADTETKRAFALVDDRIQKQIDLATRDLQSKVMSALQPIYQQLGSVEMQQQGRQVDEILGYMDREFPDWTEYANEIQDGISALDPSKVNAKTVARIYRGIKAERAVDIPKPASPYIGGPGGKHSKSVSSFEQAAAIAEETLKASGRL